MGDNPATVTDDALFETQAIGGTTNGIRPKAPCCYRSLVLYIEDAASIRGKLTRLHVLVLLARLLERRCGRRQRLRVLIRAHMRLVVAVALLGCIGVDLRTPVLALLPQLLLHRKSVVCSPRPQLSGELFFVAFRHL